MIVIRTLNRVSRLTEGRWGTVSVSGVVSATVSVGRGSGPGGIFALRGFLEARYSQRAFASPMAWAVLHSAEMGGSSCLCVRNSLFVDLLLTLLSLMNTHGDGGFSVDVRGMGGDLVLFFEGSREIVSIGCTISTRGASVFTCSSVMPTDLRKVTMSSGLAISVGVLHCGRALCPFSLQRNSNSVGIAEFIL